MKQLHTGLSRLLMIAMACAATSLPGGISAEAPKYGLSHTVKFTGEHHTVESHRARVEPRPEVSGVIPRAVRGENALQMVNPFAPSKYGTAEQNTIPDPDLLGQGDGIKLLSISF
jgi:hypothetical protein